MTRYTKHNTLEREIYLTQLNNVWWIIFSHQLLPRYSFIALWIHFLKITEACPGSFQFHFLPSVNAGAFYCHFCVVLFVLLGGGPEVPRNTWSPPLPVPLLLSLRTQSSVAPGARTEEEPPGLTIKQLDWLGGGCVNYPLLFLSASDCYCDSWGWCCCLTAGRSLWPW